MQSTLEAPAATATQPARRGSSPLPLITTLYVTQYLGVGFIYVGLTAMLRHQGVSLESLAAVSLAGVSWALKPLWAPVVDRFGRTDSGHYRNWLLALQPMLALSGLALIAIPEPARHLGLLGAAIAVYVLVSATQDIAADGLTARAVDDATRGTANGIANAAQWLGNVLGGGLIVLVYDHFGWVPAMVTLMVLSLMPLPLLLGHREPPSAGGPPSLRQAYAALGSVFRQPGGRTWGLLVMPLFLGGTTAAYGLLTPALTDAGWSVGRLGWVMGIFLVVPAALSSLLVGACIARFGRLRCLVVTGVVDALAVIGLVPLVTSGAPLVATMVALAVFVAAMAAASTVVYTVNMSLARPGAEATDFTTLAAVAMIASYLLGAALLAAAGSLGYRPVLLACAALALVGTGAAAAHSARGSR